jgi:hypothetical protein
MIDFAAGEKNRPRHALSERRRPLARQGVRTVAAIFIALAIMAAGCATGGSGEEGYPTPSGDMVPAGNASRPTAAKPGSMAGVWEGESRAGCSSMTASFNRCNADQKITLTFIEEPSGLGGFYRCAYGNSNCYNMNTTGKIVSARFDGGRLIARVAMPDGTSCLYNGRMTGEVIRGGYSCYGGGGLIEQGVWQGNRSY